MPRSEMIAPSLLMLSLAVSGACGGQTIDIGSRREPFVDEFLIEKLDGIALTLHRPDPGQVVFRHDGPWEGDLCHSPLADKAVRLWFELVDADLYAMQFVP